MKKIGLHVLALAVVFVVGFSSCQNKDAEKRIAELEERLKSLESPAATSTPGAIAQPQAPEEKPEGPLPSFEFEAMDHDFGTIKDGDIVTHVFKFKNTGQAPLIIQSARGSCGCTVPSWPKEPIPVGGTAEISAEFNSKGKLGMQNKVVTITANTWPKNTTLRIKAQVDPVQ